MSFISSLISSDEKNSEKKKIKDVKKQKMKLISNKYFLKINGQMHEISSLIFSYI